MALANFLALTEDQLKLLAEVLNDVLPCGRSRLRRSIGERVKLERKDASALIQTLGGYLLKAVPGGPLHGKVWEEFLKDLNKDLKDKALKDKTTDSPLSDERLNAVRQQEAIYALIFSERNAIALKGAMLQQRIIPHIANFETVVDLRPVFDETHTSVLAFVPVVILQLTLHTESCDTFGSQSFQLAPDSLRQMLKTLEDAQDKMTVLVSSLKTLEPKVLE